MEQSRMKELIEKYWLAETTEEEEAELKSYFSTHPIPEEYNYAAPLFRYFKEEEKLTVTGDFDEKLLTNIRERSPLKMWGNPLIKVAAVFLIALSLVFVFRGNFIENQMTLKEQETYDDPEKAYLETKRALMMISQKLNSGNTYVKEIKKFNKAEEIIHINSN